MTQLLDASRSARRRTLRRWLSPLLLALLLALAAFAIHHELKAIRPEDIVAGFRALPWSAILASLGFTALSYCALIGYDVSAFRYLRLKPPVHRLVIGSFCGYAIANTAGFAVVTGTSVRYRIHARSGLSFADAGRIGLFTALAFGIGVTVTGALGLLIEPDAISAFFYMPRNTVRGLAALVLAVVLALLVLAALGRTLSIGRFRLPLPSFRLSAMQLALSGLDIAFAAAALHVLLPAGIGYLEFVAVFCAAIAAGVLSHVPGGVGVFDAVILSAFAWRISPGALVVALLVYRVIYFLIPFALALGVLAFVEAARHSKRARLHLVRAAQGLGGVADALAPSVAAGTALIAAILLLVSSATPAYETRITLLGSVLPLPLIESAHFLSGVVASGLMFLTLGLFRRLNAAFWLTLLLLVLAGFLALLKGLAYGETLFLLLAALALFPLRDAFRRSTALLDEPLTPASLAFFALLLASIGFVAFFAFEHTQYTDRMWFEFALDRAAPRSLRALVAASVTTLLLATAMLLRAPSRPRAAPAGAEERTQAARIVAAQDRAEANLALLSGTSLLFSESGRAFIAYGAHGRSWIALGDPVGAGDDMAELIWRFRELAARARARPALYRISPDLIDACIDAGLELLKIGEDARVPLQGFARRTGPRAKAALARARADGLGFELVPKDELVWLAPALGALADAKQAGSPEGAGPGMAAPVSATLARFDIALLRRHARPVGFARVFGTATRRECVIDVLRLGAGLPDYATEFLLASLALELEARGVATLGLGVSPLADEALSPARHLDALVMEHGARFLDEVAPRAVKAGLDPVWVPRYLAHVADADPGAILADAGALIAGARHAGNAA